MACPECPHCRRSGELIDRGHESYLAQAILDELKISDADLEDRRAQRPGAFRLQLAMYVLFKLGMSVSGIGRQLQRQRQSILSGIKLITGQIDESEQLSRTVARLSLVVVDSKRAA